MSSNNFFERCYVVNLASRPDRLKRFMDNLPDDWPFPTPEHYNAIAGKLCPRPEWWGQGGGAWGCYKSHLNLIEKCLNENVRSVLLLEDDALFIQNFTEKAMAFLEHLPNAWDMIYLGGQHLMVEKHPPLKINEWVYQPYNVNRTHAFALNREMMKVVYRFLSTNDWRQGNHIDHHLGRLHMRRKHKIYCPKEWLVGQAEGKSNISGKRPPDRIWKPAEVIASVKTEDVPFVVVTGLHSSGSSCIAGILYHLGVHLGNKLGGYYGNTPGRDCGYEAQGLASLCEQIIPFPGLELKKSKIWTYKKLRTWINDRKREASKKDTIAGCKYPQLCRLGTQITNICGDSLRVINIERSLDESILSLQKRCPQKEPHIIAAHQRWLNDGRDDFLSRCNIVLRLDYSEVIENKEQTVSQICHFLDLNPTEEQIKAAINSINPSKKHITLEGV